MTIISLMLAAAVLLTGCGKSKASGLFDGMEWDTAYETAKQKLLEMEGAEPAENADQSKLQLEVENYLGVEGVKGRIECSFEEQKMDEVFVYLEFDENAHTNEEIMEQYAAKLTESYGKASQETAEMKIWKLKESEVQLANFSYGVLVLDYKPLS